MQKKFWQSKAMWGAVITFIGGGLTALGHVELGQFVMTAGASLGIIGIRAAQK